jgi:hypothetical protein
MERETAARFSFLLGLPAVTLAAFYELRVLAKGGLGSQGWIAWRWWSGSCVAGCATRRQRKPRKSCKSIRTLVNGGRGP